MDELKIFRYRPGQTIVEQGHTVADEEPSLFLIAGGIAQIVVDGIERPVTLSQGQNFGERSLFVRSEPRTATVVAVDDVTALGLSRETYRELGLSRLKWKSANYKDLSQTMVSAVPGFPPPVTSGSETG